MKFDPHNISGHYVLVGQTPVIERDLFKWAEWFETADRRVALDQVGEARISTVFLGLDYRWDGGPPFLFETMVKIGTKWEMKGRVSTWVEAEQVHRAAVGELILKLIQPVA